MKTPLIIKFLIIGFILIVAIALYIYWRLQKTAKAYGLTVETKKIKIGIFIKTILLTLSCINIKSTFALIVLHMITISAILDIITYFYRRIRKYRGIEKTKLGFLGRQYERGILTILIVAAMIGYGYFNMANVTETHYTIDTNKKIRAEGYRIALITDVHYGTVQNKNVLKEKISDINKAEPDIVVLGGDIVEEKTSKEDMQEVFQLLGEIKNKYGIYYVYGNHDQQPYTKHKMFTKEELENTIQENKIQILEDKYVNIENDIILAGRKDAAWENTSKRASSKEILSTVDQDKYIIMIDHQPIEAEENDIQKVDMELSGHTHAGQIWPIGFFLELTGTLNYGKYQVGNCNVFVSSGFAGWGYPIRTSKHSEYVIIDIK